MTEGLIIPRICELWRMRQRWHRAEKSLVLQGKAICRLWTDGDKDAANALFDGVRDGTDENPTVGMALQPFFSSIEQFHGLRKKIEKELAAMAMQSPGGEWMVSVKGFGPAGLAGIIGEAGDLSNYPDHSKLWRRMGMAPFTKDGVTRSGKQWKVAGGLKADDWTEYGYSGIRRALMFVIEDSLYKANGPYRDVYLARKKYLQERAIANGLTVAPAAKIPAKQRHMFVSKGHIDQDAKRYMGKRLLRDLWKAWRRASRAMTSNGAMSPYKIAEIGRHSNANYPAEERLPISATPITTRKETANVDI
jgi:hypothetical protein